MGDDNENEKSKKKGKDLSGLIILKDVLRVN